MTEWREVTLGDVCELKRGYDLPTSNREEGDVPIVSSSGITGYHSVAKAPAPGVVTGRYGTLGEVFFIQEPFWPLNTSLYVRDFKGNEARFVAALLQLLELGQNEGAAAVPGVNRNHLHRLPVVCPGVEVQRRIADVLGALDDLIENNRRRIGLLEQMAQAIYREWFVRFRYPGHEDATFVDSPLGPIPKGWEVTTCGDALMVLGGGTPSKKEPDFWEGGTIPWYTPSDLTKHRTRFATQPAMSITEAGLRHSSARLFPAGSVLMTSRATLGVLTITTVESSCNQGFIVIPPDERCPPSFIYEWLDDHDEELEGIGTGATFKEITKGAFKRVPFLLPTAAVLDSFRCDVTPIDDEVRVLEAENRTLATIRDLLLPKLVTGEIDVSGLDLDAIAEPAR